MRSSNVVLEPAAIQLQFFADVISELQEIGWHNLISVDEALSTVQIRLLYVAHLPGLCWPAFNDL